MEVTREQVTIKQVNKSVFEELKRLENNMEYTNYIPTEILIKLLTKEMKKLKLKLSKNNVKRHQERYQKRYDATERAKAYVIEHYSENMYVITYIIDINKFANTIIRYYGFDN